MKTPPAKFTITITERDRQGAKEFANHCNCLIAHALHRRGYTKVLEGLDKVRINGLFYDHEYYGSNDLHLLFSATKPFYSPAVVGKKITFTRSA